MNKRILVTGSEGYIGKHLIKMMLSRGGYDITEFDKNSSNPEVRIDLAYDPIPYFDEPFHTVIHLAAYARVNESVKEPEKYYINNIFSTLNVLKSVEYSNFILASTGSAECLQSPYSISKKVCEDIVADFCKNKKYTVFRFYNVIGSDGFLPSNPDSLLFNLMQAEKNGYFTVFGTDYNTKDGSCVRDYVHVNEICNSLIEAIEKPNNSLENLGSGVGYTVKEMVDIYKKVNNVDFDVVYAPRRAGDAESNVLKNISFYMKKAYTIEKLLEKP